MEHYDWNEFAEAVQSVYGGEVDFEEGYARCPECDEPILKCDWPKHNFATCPVCEWNIEADMNGNDPWEELEEVELEDEDEVEIDWESIEAEKEFEEGWDEEGEEE